MRKLGMFIVLIFEVAAEAGMSLGRRTRSAARGVKNFVVDIVKNWKTVLNYCLITVVGLICFFAAAAAMVFITTVICTHMCEDINGILSAILPDTVSIVVTTVIVIFIWIAILWTIAFCIHHKRAFKIYSESDGKYSFTKALQVEKEEKPGADDLWVD